MAKFKQDIFQEFQERHFRVPCDYKPTDVQVIEVKGFETDTQTFRSFSVKPDELGSWFSDKQTNRANDTNHYGHKLRVVIGYLGKGVKNDYVMHDQKFAPGDIPPGASITTLPFSQEHYQLICQKFSLPKVTYLLVERGVRTLRGHFQVTKMPSEQGRIIYSFSLSSFSSLLIGTKLAASMSYCPSTGVTNALVLGSGEQDGFSWLQQDLEQLAPLSDSPFLVPMIICQRLTDAISDSVDGISNRLHQVEIGSGQTGIMIVGDNGLPMPRGHCEDPNLSVAILSVAQQLVAVEAYIKGHSVTVRSVKSEMLEFPWHQFPSTNSDEVREQNKLIAKQLDFIDRSLSFALFGVEHLKQRANVQATAINNLFAQRNSEMNTMLAESSTSIARDTRRDGSAMKSIAVLTMVFLPATFIATYFGIPAVEASQPSQGIYWAVTVPLTLVVLFMWRLYFYFCVVKKDYWRFGKRRETTNLDDLVPDY
ncbi:uncharacterized protein F4822DRAFT_430986 [Hypoxylon trugodes]|uniref:uncharacterized protein n=1 Tax=Hypoxylon trugodes TaxID=326681 RepID=UPI00218E038F|nr:uncharacterized protein F4822DRAFT_430986 [Hypoxylon trugodes]KAI1386113.1 hypothetical protein F4822DRAFT_430986 [Hypoxylon trugodes]